MMTDQQAVDLRIEIIRSATEIITAWIDRESGRVFANNTKGIIDDAVRVLSNEYERHSPPPKETSDDRPV